MQAAAHGESTLGIPKKVGEEFVGKDAKGHAAGVLFVAPDGDLLLLRRASGEENYPGHWALPGGKADGDETPEAAADREVAEEIGDRPKGAKRILDRRITPSGMAFHTFAQPVAEKFAPTLNGEHSGYAWAPPGQLPQPLHPGVAATLADRLHAGKPAADMTPEDWSGLTAGLLKWIAEEEDEPEHAQDDKLIPAPGDVIEFDDDYYTDKGPASTPVLTVEGNQVGVDWGTKESPEPVTFDWSKLADDATRTDVDGKGWWSIKAPTVTAHDRIALDRASVRRVDQDGHLHIEIANISKAAVNPYYGSEIPDAELLGLDPMRIYNLLRDPAELEKAAPTFAGKPLLSKHRPQMADAYDDDLIAGSIGTEVVFEAPYLKAPLVIWKAPSIEGVETGKQRELSCGYRYDADMTPGTYEGAPYDGVMRNIRGNHVALVEEGRAGNDVVVGDSKLETQNMAKTTLTRQGLLASGALLAYVAPRLAKDATINLTGLVKGVTHKTWKTDKVRLAADLKTALKGKLAKDADLEDVVALLDKLDGEEPGDPVLDDDPMVDPDMSVDADKEEIKKMLEAKGCTPEEIEKVMGMMGAGTAQDNPPPTPGTNKPGGAPAGKDADKDDDKKDMVSKPAMDAAIKAATKSAEEATMKRLSDIREAERAVAPLIGTVTVAMDSAEKIYAAALKANDVDVAGLDANAMAKMVGLLVKQKGASRPTAPLAADTAGLAAFQKQHGLEGRTMRSLG